jgi:hypothetical protein
VSLAVDDGDPGVRQPAGDGVDVAPEVRRAVAAGEQERGRGDRLNRTAA